MKNYFLYIPSLTSIKLAIFFIGFLLKTDILTNVNKI